MSTRPDYPLLLADAGNSAVKFALVRRPGSPPRMLATVPTPDLTASRVRTLLRSHKAQRLAASCVVPLAAQVLRSADPQAFFIGPSTVLPFRTAVDRRTVGADRLANIAEATRRFGRRVVVADFGTAATFDVLDGRGVFAGGAIAPGLHTMAACVARRATQLPRIEPASPPRRPGRNTDEALQLGVTGGYTGLVRELIGRLGSRGRTIVFTGGDAAAVAKLTGLRPRIDPLWTLRGIEALANSTCRVTRPR